MFEETKETQNAEQAAEGSNMQETMNPYLANAIGTDEETVATDSVEVAEVPVTETPVADTPVTETATNAFVSNEEMPQFAQEQAPQNNWQATPVASPIPEEPKKNPAVKVAIILAIVAVVLIVAIVALAFSGLFGNKKAKVAQAFKNTFEESETYLKKVWKAKDYEGMFESKESCIEMDVTLPEDVTVEAVLNSTEEETNLFMDLGMAGSDFVEVEAYANETQIFLSLPEHFDYLFYIDLETAADDIQVMVDNGLIDSYTADTFVEALEAQGEGVELSEEAVEQLEKDIKTAWTEMFAAIKVKEIDAEEFTVNDEEVKCDGYTIEVTPDILADVAEATADAYLDNEEVMEWLEALQASYDSEEATEMLDTIKESAEELRDIDEDDIEDSTFYVNVYVYDEKVARVEVTEPGDDDEVWFVWAIEGGNYPLENTYFEFAYDGDKLEIYRNSSVEDDEYWVEYEIVDTYGTSYVMDVFYTPETGEFEIDVMEDDYWNWLYTYGTFEKTDDHTIEIEVEAFEMDEEEILSGEIVIKDECGAFAKPEGGEEINILTMSMEEWEELIMEAYMALY